MRAVPTSSPPTTSAVAGGLARSRAELPILPIAIVALGLVLLGASAAYYGYRAYARSTLDELNVVLPEPRVIGAKEDEPSDSLRFGPDPAAQNVLSANPRYWTNSRTSAGALDAADIEAAGYWAPGPEVLAGPAPPATNIRVPAIGVDSALLEQGEGNVFSRLPQIPGLLRDGEDV